MNKKKKVENLIPLFTYYCTVLIFTATGESLKYVCPHRSAVVSYSSRRYLLTHTSNHCRQINDTLSGYLAWSLEASICWECMASVTQSQKLLLWELAPSPGGTLLLFITQCGRVMHSPSCLFTHPTDISSSLAYSAVISKSSTVLFNKGYLPIFIKMCNTHARVQSVKYVVKCRIIIMMIDGRWGHYLKKSLIDDV